MSTERTIKRRQMSVHMRHGVDKMGADLALCGTRLLRQPAAWDRRLPTDGHRFTRVSKHADSRAGVTCKRCLAQLAKVAQ